MSGYYSKVYKEESYTTKYYWCVITLGKRTKDSKYEVHIIAKCDDETAKDGLEIETTMVYGKLKNARTFYKEAKIGYIDKFLK
jgi:hypothetical protein